MARPRSVKRMIQDLLDDYEGDAIGLAQELAMAPNRLRRLILRPIIIACDEERRVRDLHRLTYPEIAEANAREHEPCRPTDPTPTATPPNSDDSPPTTKPADSPPEPSPTA